MIIKRYNKNPIFTPNKNQSWEAEAVLNGCPIEKGNKIFLVYRAISLLHYHTLTQTKLMISDIGIAESKDGINFSNRKRFIAPEHEWEKFGCEDPRITKLNNKYYIFYTAISYYPFRAEGIKIGMAISKDLTHIQEKHLITPFNAKAMALFPEKINGKMWAILTVHTDKPPAKICLTSFEKENDLWSENYWKKWYQNFEKYALPLQRRPQDHIEVGAPPVKTKYGWLVFYSYIKNYFSANRLFSIEAVLLDLKNPMKILGRTDYPLLTPEEYYERIGIVPNVIFPSGALMRKNSLYLYYGAADTTCSLAFIDVAELINKMLKKEMKLTKFTRAKENPIILPIKGHSWETKLTFNPATIYLGGKVHILYRAMSDDNTSTIGYAQSKDGIHIDHRSSEPIYIPRESFEQKLTPGGNSGVEDPRLTKIGDKIYMLYTAFDGKNPPRVALTWIKVKDFLAQKWNWTKPVLISPPDLDDKDAALFPEKIKGKYLVIHRSGDDIDLSFCQTLNFDGTWWLEEYRWISPRKGMWDSKKVGIAAPPIKTKQGWLALYHGVSEDKTYRVGAILCDIKDPTKIVARTDEPIFEPETPYEKEGEIPNVVFPCGAVLIGNKVFMYYGGADKVVGVATMELETLLKTLESCRC
jgi:beta-1,2-mannobiose phosphorylase / 1,2-beta-oligomannan phosphorylase